MNKFLVTLLTITLFSCDKSGEVLSFKSLIGHRIDCETKKDNIDTYVYVYTPHIMGVWSESEKFTVEYFKSEFAKADGSIYFKRFLKGHNNLNTTPIEDIKLTNRRLGINVKNKKISLIAIQGMDENQKPLKGLTFSCKRGPKIKNYFSLDGL